MRLHDLASPTRDVLPGSWATSQDVPYYYIVGVLNVSEDIDEPEYEELDPNDRTTPDFWSLYFARGFGNTTIITDFATREAALEYAKTSATIPHYVYDFTAEGYYG